MTSAREQRNSGQQVTRSLEWITEFERISTPFPAPTTPPEDGKRKWNDSLENGDLVSGKDTGRRIADGIDPTIVPEQKTWIDENGKFKCDNPVSTNTESARKVIRFLKEHGIKAQSYMYNALNEIMIKAEYAKKFRKLQKRLKNGEFPEIPWFYTTRHRESKEEAEGMLRHWRRYYPEVYHGHHWCLDLDSKCEYCAQLRKLGLLEQVIDNVYAKV